MIIQGEEFSGEERSCVIFLIFIFILVKLTILSFSLSVSFLFFQNQTNSCSWPKFPSQGTRVINLGEIKVPPLVYGTWCTDVIGNRRHGRDMEGRFVRCNPPILLRCHASSGTRSIHLLQSSREKPPPVNLAA